MWKLFEKSEIKSIIIVRTCVGCILPNNAKLINTGTYRRIENGHKTDEPFYDYEIEEVFFDSFYEQNYDQLLKYNLVDEEPKEVSKEDKNPIKETTLRGYAREWKRKEEK